MNGWHKCHLCDCEYYDPSSDGYWGWCPGCRKVEAKKENQKGTQDEISNQKHVERRASQDREEIRSAQSLTR